MDTAQKQKALIGAVLLGIIVIGLLLWYMATHEPKVVTPVGETPTTPGTYEKKTLTDNGQYYDAQASYPAQTPLLATAGAEADQAAVYLMKSFAETQIEAFKERSGFDAFTAEDITMMGLDQGRKYSLDIDFETSTSPSTVTFVYTIYEDTLGAHPNGYFRTFTFNTKTGAGVHLDDLFQGPYLERLSEIARAKLAVSIAKASGGEANIEYIESGTLPIADSFQNFALKDDTFVLIFPPYQVGPYALGVQMVEIPMSELGDILTAEYK